MITGGNGNGSGAAWSTDALVLLTRFRALLPRCSTPTASRCTRSTNCGTHVVRSYLSTANALIVGSGCWGIQIHILRDCTHTPRGVSFGRRLKPTSEQ